MHVFKEVRVLTEFIRHQLTGKSRRGYGIHSPFAYKLVRDIFLDQRAYSELTTIQDLRNGLSGNDRRLIYPDHGAGSKHGSHRSRKVSQLVQTISTRPRYGRILFLLGRRFGPANMIELGTGLGLGTCYLALSNPGSRVYTIESSTPLLTLARENFKKVGVANIQTLHHEFSAGLEILQHTVDRFDLVFFDGNHRYQPTLEYYEQCMGKAHEQSVFIFDDIHWSGEMERAWESIKADDRVRMTIDIFQMGLVFFRKELSRQHFKIRY